MIARAWHPRSTAGGIDIAPKIGPIALLMAAVVALSMWRYRQTLDRAGRLL